jgi:hypothetical protein
VLAGDLEASRGLITALYMKEITDPRWRTTRASRVGGLHEEYYPDGALDDRSMPSATTSPS